MLATDVTSTLCRSHYYYIYIYQNVDVVDG